MEVNASWASLIVGVATAAVLAAGHFLARRGQKEQAEQQRAANNLAAVERQRDRAEAAEIRERDRADRERERADRLEVVNDEQRETYRRRESAQAARCEVATRQLTDALTTLRDVVVSEVATAAARTVLDQHIPHPHESPEDPDGAHS